jgi:tetratricopeptide (TPR) repeat protein
MVVKEDSFRELMNHGHSAAWEKNWEEAVTWYSRALEKMPNQPNALANLGLAYYELRRWDEALRVYLQYAKEIKDDPMPLEKLGQIYEKKGMPEEAARLAFSAGELCLKTREIKRAIENWERTTKHDPGNLQAHARMALVYERMGKKQEAVREYLIIASLYQHNDDHENAILAVDHALAQVPESQEAQRAKEMINDGEPLPMPARSSEINNEMTNKSQKSVQKTGELRLKEEDPILETHQRALKSLADILFEEREMNTKPPERSSHRGIQTIVEGARSLFSRPVDHNRIILHLGQALELRTTGDNSQAAEDLEKAINAGLSDPAAIFELGYLRVLENRLESAIRTLQKVSHHQDYSLATRLLLGKIYQKMGRLAEASEEYLSALRLADKETVNEKQAREIDQQYGLVKETITQNSDKDANAQFCKNVEELFMRKDWRKKIEETREQLNAQAVDGQLLPLAEIITQSGDTDFVQALNKIYQIANAGYSRSALEEAFFLMQSTPGYLPLHTYVGDLLLMQGQMEDAITKYIVTARTYETRNEPDQAIDIYHRVIELIPMADTPRRHLIALLIALGNHSDALVETLNLADVYYHLADLEEARKTYMDALDIAGKGNFPVSRHVGILHSIADIDMQSLKWRQALELFGHICKIAPDDEEARYRLVDLNMRLGQQDQAVSEVDNYLAYLERNNETKKAVAFLKKLEKENSTWGVWINPRVSRLIS